MKKPSSVEPAGEGDFRLNMKKTMMGLMMGAALLAFAPGMGDPYIIFKILAVGLPCLVLCSMKGPGSSLAPAAMLGLAAACAVSLSSVDIGYAIVGSRLHPFDSLLALFGLFAVLCAAARSEVAPESLAKMICWASLPMSFYAFYQRIVGNNDPLIPAGASIPYGMRVLSTQGSPLYLGACLAIVAVCAAHLMKRKELIGSAAMACAIPALWFTQTRGAILAAAIGVVLVFKWYRLLLVAPFAFMARAAMQSDMGRVEVWKIAFRSFMDHPWLGWGPGNFYLAFRKNQSWGMVEVFGTSMSSQAHAHNDILQVLVLGGVLALAAYLMIWGGIASKIWGMQGDKKALMVGMVGAFVAVSSFNPVPYSASVLFVAMLGAVTAGGAGKRLLPALSSLLVVLIAAPLCMAEKYYADGIRSLSSGDVVGEAAAMTMAAKYNPFEVQIACRQANAFQRLIAASAQAEARLPLSRISYGIAKEAVGRHPNDSYAHELYGKNVLLLHMAGQPQNPQEALDHFNKAQELAPMFKPIMVRRYVTARGIGDGREAARAKADMLELDSHWGKL